MHTIKVLFLLSTLTLATLLNGCDEPTWEGPSDDPQVSYVLRGIPVDKANLPPQRVSTRSCHDFAFYKQHDPSGFNQAADGAKLQRMRFEGNLTVEVNFILQQIDRTREVFPTPVDIGLKELTLQKTTLGSRVDAYPAWVHEKRGTRTKWAYETCVFYATADFRSIIAKNFTFSGDGRDLVGLLLASMLSWLHQSPADSGPEWQYAFFIEDAMMPVWAVDELGANKDLLRKFLEGHMQDPEFFNKLAPVFKAVFQTLTDPERGIVARYAKALLQASMFDTTRCALQWADWDAARVRAAQDLAYKLCQPPESVEAAYYRSSTHASWGTDIIWLYQAHLALALDTLQDREALTWLAVVHKNDLTVRARPGAQELLAEIEQRIAAHGDVKIDGL